MRPIALIILLTYFSFTTHGQDGEQYANLSYDELDSLGDMFYELGKYSDAIPFANAYIQKAQTEKNDLQKAHGLNDLGNMYKRMGNYNRALSLYEQAKDIRKKLLGEEHHSYASSLESLGLLHLKMGNYDGVLPLFLQSKDIREKEYGMEHHCYAMSINNLAFFHSTMGNYKQALPLYLQATKINEKVVGIEHSSYAMSLNNLASLHKKMGNYSKALPLLIQAKEIKEKVVGIEHSSYATSLNNLALLYDRMGNYSKALPLYLQAKDIKEKSLGKEHPSYVTSLYSLALFYEAMGSYNKALLLCLQVKAIDEKTLGKEHPYYANTLHSLASLYAALGSYSLALPLYLQALDIKEKSLGKEHPSYVLSLYSLALFYEEMGSYNKALLLCLQVKSIEEKTLGKEHPYFANTLHSLASLYEALGSYSLALPLYLQALDIKEKAVGKAHPSYANTLTNLADLHEQMGCYNEALPLYLEAKDIREKALGKEHPDFGSSLNHLASLYEQMGKYDQALQLNLQAIDIKEKTMGKEHLGYASSLNDLAILYEALGNYAQSLSLFLQAKDIREKALGKEHPLYGHSLNDLAGLYGQMGNYFNAWEVLHYAMNSSSRLQLPLTFDKVWFDRLRAAAYPSHAHLENMVESLGIAYQLLETDSGVVETQAKQAAIAGLANALLIRARNQVSNEEDKLRMLSLSHGWLQRSLKVLNPAVDAEKAFNLSDQNKSALLLEAIKSELAYQLGELPDSVIWQDRKLLKEQSQLQAKLMEKLMEVEEDSLIDALNHVNQNIDDFVRMIELKYPKYHQIKYQQIDAEAQEIQDLLEENTAFLEYVVGDSVVHIFYVDKKQVQWSKLSVGNRELKDRVKLLHRSLSDYQSNESYQEYRRQAHWFYKNLVAPALEDKQNITNLIIVTDGELGHLPFETFLVENASDQPHYLLNDFTISYTYSATLWKDNIEASNPQNNGEIFGVAANYDLMPDSSMLAVRLPPDQWKRGELTALPAARKEVETLQERYEGFFAFDSLATERVVKAMVSDFSILHFATHGILDRERPVLSSLAFTEDNDSTESNFWQAHEISQAQLNADLVVLSACETGYGEFEQGNGIASLARAFMYAGAPALVVSLWQVNDEATSELMKNFYDNLAMGMKKDEALREAKLEYIKSAEGILAHPAFWSPFIMMGKTDAVEIKKKRNETAWGVGLGMLVLFGIGGIMLSKRRT